MSFAQLTRRESLRDIENCLTAFSSKLYHCGIKHAVPRSTLAMANEFRDWQIYDDFAKVLIGTARQLYQEVVSSNVVDKQTGVHSDEYVRLTGYKSSREYPENFRMVTYEDFSTGVVYRFITNNFELPSITISELYRERWNVEFGLANIHGTKS